MLFFSIQCLESGPLELGSQADIEACAWALLFVIGLQPELHRILCLCSRLQQSFIELALQCVNSNRCGSASQSPARTALLFLTGHLLVIWRLCFGFPLPTGYSRNSRLRSQPFVSDLCRSQGNDRLSRMNLKHQGATNPLIATILLHSSRFLGQRSLYFLCKVRRVMVRGR